MARLSGQVSLDLDRYPTGQRWPVWEAVTAHLATGGVRTLSVAAVHDGQVIGMGQVVCRDDAWHVARLLTAKGLSASALWDVVVELLLNLAQRVGASGGARLHARVKRSTSAMEAFGRAGFQSYSHESVYILRRPSALPLSGDALPIRPQEGKDAWAVYQLYCAVTPRLVQQAEGLDAGSFELHGAAPVRAVQRVGDQRLVLDLGGEILGYMRISHLARRLHLLLHPQAYEYAPGMITTGVAELAPLPMVRCVLPEYQSELGTPLEEEGFRFIGAQVVLLKSLTVTARAETRAVRQVLEPNLGTARTASR